MPGRTTGSWTCGPTKAPGIDTWGLPVLQRAREEFDRQYAPLQSISSEELARHWQRLAEDDHASAGRGRLQPKDKRAIALRVSQAVKEMDLTSTGRVEKDEWVHHMLLLQSGAPRAATQINSVLKVVLQHHPKVLGDLQNMFEIADTANTGWLTRDELLDVYRRKLWRLQILEDGTVTCDADMAEKDPEQHADEIMKAMDLDGDGQISYTDFMAFCLGRRCQEVFLHLYDLSNGSFASASSWLLGERIEGIWHCGVVAFNKEYYFGGELVYDTPGQTCFGKPVKTIPLGTTLWRKDELHSYIVNELKPVFSRETYDVIYSNCNHFADKLCMWLTGKCLPKEIGQQAQELMRYNVTRAVAPLLNRWLGNIQGRSVGNMDDGIAKKMTLKSSPNASAADAMIDGNDLRVMPGMIVTVLPADGRGPPVLGTVCGPESPAHAMSQKEQNDETRHGTVCQQQSEATCWVTYFGPPTLSARRSTGRICTELLPHDRISKATLDDVGSKHVYDKAMRVLALPSRHGDRSSGDWRCHGSASCGLAPMSTLPPGSMSDNVELESPRPSSDHEESIKELAKEFAMSRRELRELAREHLLTMGFGCEAAEAALSATSYDVKKAAKLLAEGTIGPEMEVPSTPSPSRGTNESERYISL